MITLLIQEELISKITASNYFILDQYSNSYKESVNEIERGKTDLILEIPANFEKDLVKENESPVFMAVDAINGVKAGLGAAYLQSIIKSIMRMFAENGYNYQSLVRN